ncbi:MAG: fumarate hydratase [Candidatus Heimdallarchaeota archaeon]|nr:fumarate hydratase [Candidatus Heimdallarchaeota archaeon]
MGVTGEGTVIDVGIELAARHPASLPVGVVFSCWALRHATAVISKDGTVTYEEH